MAMQNDAWRPTRIAEFAWEVVERSDGGEEVLSCTKHEGFVPSLEYFGKQVYSKDTTNYKRVSRGQYAYATIHLDEGSIDCLRIRDKGIISPMYTVFDVDSSQVDRGFLLELLRSDRMLQRYSAIGQGSVNRRKSINFGTLSKEILSLPPLPEQKKIAAILSSVDEAIQATEAVIEQTRRVKDGLLQDLLAKGIRHTSFEESQRGEIPEGWELRQLGEVTEVTKLAGFEYTNHFDYSIGGEVTVVRALNLRDGVFDLSDTHTIPKAVSDALPRSRLREGDTLFTYVGVNVGEVALTPEGRFHLGPNVARITPSPGLVPAYLCYYMQSQRAKRQVQQLVSTTSQPSMSMTNIRQIRVVIPPLDAQERIVAAMAGVEGSIQSSRDALYQLGVTKAGLLQDLLTGKVRVSV